MTENKGNPFHDEEGKFTTGPNQGGAEQKVELKDFDVIADGKRCGRFLAASEEEAVAKAKNKFPERFSENTQIETKELKWKSNPYNNKLKETLGVGEEEEAAEFPISVSAQSDDGGVMHRDVSTEDVISFLEKSLGGALSEEDKQKMMQEQTIPIRLLEQLRIYSEDELEDELSNYFEDYDGWEDE